MKNRKVIAIYYPQYHAIPLNDKYWGEGFTDWQNVKKSKPLFNTHKQPKTPLNNNYYDPRNLSTLQEQSRLAKEFGVYGFCFYHYWFDGEALLEEPLLTFLNNKDIQMPFCLSWANETWTKRWVGDSRTVIIKQNHTPEKEIWKKHFYFLLPFFKDERAIKIDGKPIFLIFQPFIINQIIEMLEYWQELAIQEGLPGIFFIATKRHEYFPTNILSGFSGVMKFQPSNARNSVNFKANPLYTNALVQKIRGFGERTIDILYSFKQKFEGVKHIDSNRVWKIILKEAANYNQFEGKAIFESAYVNWDNTARYTKKATIYSHVEPDDFEKKLDLLFQTLEKNKEENMVFINAWNEWAEGAFLEPDEEYGLAYLKALQNVINQI